mmetsp:Transcript_15008/g.41264  ORF Transcript_15008/g.41264 Transcript_15008/m.41264 type:complete len:246 (+) Transcript_15008:1563-2300(+)
MTRSPDLSATEGVSSSRKTCRKAPLFSCISRIVRPPLPISQPAVCVSTRSFALVRKFCVGSRPPSGSCFAGGKDTSGSPSPAPAASAAAAFSGLYLKSLGIKRPRSAMSCTTRWMLATAVTTWSSEPSRPIGVSGMPMTFSLPMLSSTPEPSWISLMVAPLAPTTTGTAAAGTIITKIPTSSAAKMSCILRSFSTMPRQAPSFWSAAPLIVTIRSLKRLGVSCSPETSIIAPVRSERSRRMALLL